MEIRHLGYEHIDGLVDLYKLNKNEFKNFTPHPFTKEVLTKIIDETILDLYYVVMFEDAVVGYGMLRGMDEGYAFPRLGIAVGKDVYGTGVATTLLEFLEVTSRLRGYKKICLRVYIENSRAHHFYAKLGYTYEPFDEKSVLGLKEL